MLATKSPPSIRVGRPGTTLFLAAMLKLGWRAASTRGASSHQFDAALGRQLAGVAVARTVVRVDARYAASTRASGPIFGQRNAHCKWRFSPHASPSCRARNHRRLIESISGAARRFAHRGGQRRGVFLFYQRACRRRRLASAIGDSHQFALGDGNFVRGAALV